MATGDESFPSSDGVLPALANRQPGFTLMIVAILGQIPALLLLAAAVAAAVGMIGHPGDFFDRIHFGELQPNDWTAMAVVAIALAVSQVLLPLVGVGGKLLCGSAPTSGATRGCAYGSGACDGLILVTNLLYYFILIALASNARSERDLQSIQMMNLGLGCFQWILMPTSLVLFMIFTFKIATALDSAPLRSAATRFLIVLGVAIVGVVLVICVAVGGIVFVGASFRGGRDGGAIVAIIAIGALVLYVGLILAAFIAYLWLLFRARSVTGTAGEGGIGMEYGRG